MKIIDLGETYYLMLLERNWMYIFMYILMN